MKRATVFLTCFFLLVALSGCDAFVRKFTRKSKKENLPGEELVLAPEEYKPSMSQEELYRQYLLYWNSWQSELIESLNNVRSNRKKQLSCAEQALKNLTQLKIYLNAETNKKLDVYIAQLKDLKGSIAADSSNMENSFYRGQAERLRRNILRDFSFNKIKGSMVPPVENSGA